MTAPRSSSATLTWALFLAGPVIWFAHFMGVYLVAEAACAAGADAEALGLPVVGLVTLAATAVAVAATLALAVRARRQWLDFRQERSWLAGDDRNPGLALAGFLLGLLFATAILFVGVPAAFLESC